MKIMIIMKGNVDLKFWVGLTLKSMVLSQKYWSSNGITIIIGLSNKNDIRIIMSGGQLWIMMKIIINVVSGLHRHWKAWSCRKKYWSSNGITLIIGLSIKNYIRIIMSGGHIWIMMKIMIIMKWNVYLTFWGGSTSKSMVLSEKYWSGNGITLIIGLSMKNYKKL